MGERWFSEEELAEMSRPTMERAIEAIEEGRERGGRDAGRLETGMHGWREIRPGDRTRHRRERQRGGDDEQNGEAQEAPPHSPDYHVILKPSWTKRWKFD